MGELTSLWAFQENHDMEQLGQKLLYTTLELETLKSEAMEEMTKNKEYINQLIHLLKHALYERDEAITQIQKLLNNTNTLLPQTNFPTIPHFQTEFKKPANSSVTESNSFNSSPVDSLFDAVSSPELSNINSLRVNQPLVQQEFDQASFVIDNLVKGRVLPQNGKFLQAVLQAGPLLQTLLLAGPLPTWRNPPQLQTFQIPPVSINGCDQPEVFDQKPLVTVAQLGSRSVNEQPMLSFGTNCVNNGGFVSLAKRQRLS